MKKTKKKKKERKKKKLDFQVEDLWAAAKCSCVNSGVNFL